LGQVQSRRRSKIMHTSNSYRNELKTITSKTDVFEEKRSTIFKPKRDINKDSFIIGQILKERKIVMNE